MRDPSPDLTALGEAAKAAGEGLLKRFASVRELSVRAKSGPTDLVSIADEEAERTVRAILERARPSYAVLGEEGGVGGGDDRANQWVIDPLDGTTNFLFGAPIWGVTIALVREGRAEAGVTYLPALDEFYMAERGKGAWLNGARIQVSGRASLIESVLACGIPFAGKPELPLFSRDMLLLTKEVAGIRRTGAGAADIAWVAAGRWDAYWERAVSAWDIAGGVILVEEAGGRATGADGGPLNLTGGHVCVSNGPLHDTLVARLNQARREEEQNV